VPEPLTSLLAELTRVTDQLSQVNGKEDSRLAGSASVTHQPATAPAESHGPDRKASGEIEDKSERHVAGVVIGIDAESNPATKLEQIEVTPEPDGRVSIVVRVKRVE
jgi:hypothetical protein